MLCQSGVLRHANHGIRYAMSPEELESFLSEQEPQ
jgi:hypothetical protein